MLLEVLQLLTVLTALVLVRACVSLEVMVG
jgi:hypothetical protein